MSALEMCVGLNYKLKVNQPVISEMPAQMVITVNISGDPTSETPTLMPPLYATAYAIRSAYKSRDMVFTVEKLRGRWPDKNKHLAREKWQGIYALPVPNDVTELPTIKKEKQVAGVSINLTQWHYGKVAQILHVGPFTEEAATIEILMNFISQSGYKTKANTHEEIYLSDPTKTTPDKLKTIILYQIEPA